MEVINPNPGTCVDRQTILILKIEAGQKKNGVFVKHWADECNAIQDYLEKNFFLLVPKSIQDPYDKLYKELAAVNKQLWDLEDEQRIALAEFESKHGLSATELVPDGLEDLLLKTGIRSFKITKLNNKRAQLVSQINTLFGILPQASKINKGQSQ